MAGTRELLLKRDDASGVVIGGNKVRGLEFLLGTVSAGDHVLTVGPRGSTHALATARCARQLGARTTVLRWDQAMNPAARQVDAKLREEARVIDTRWVAAAYVAAAALRARGGVRWIPAGGASALALLGHVNAAMELAEQLASRARAPAPDLLVVPLGTGGTAAGLALGLRLAEQRLPVCAVRVVPRIVGRAGRVIALADAAARLLERITGERVPRVSSGDIRVEHGFYGGGYGRALAAGAVDDSAMRAAGVQLDDTYSRKAFAAAMAADAELPLLWLTFDGRLLQH